MFRVQIRHQTTPEKKMFFGAPVPQLSDVLPVIVDLEKKWSQWEANGYPQLSPDDPIQYLEGSEVYVVTDDGKEYWLDENDEFQIIN